jgi:hypothetical protein
MESMRVPRNLARWLHLDKRPGLCSYNHTHQPTVGKFVRLAPESLDWARAEILCAEADAGGNRLL